MNFETGAEFQQLPPEQLPTLVERFQVGRRYLEYLGDSADTTEITELVDRLRTRSDIQMGFGTMAMATGQLAVAERLYNDGKESDIATLDLTNTMAKESVDHGILSGLELVGDLARDSLPEEVAKLPMQEVLNRADYPAITSLLLDEIELRVSRIGDQVSLSYDGTFVGDSLELQSLLISLYIATAASGNYELIADIANKVNGLQPTTSDKEKERATALQYGLQRILGKADQLEHVAVYLHDDGGEALADLTKLVPFTYLTGTQQSLQAIRKAGGGTVKREWRNAITQFDAPNIRAARRDAHNMVDRAQIKNWTILKSDSELDAHTNELAAGLEQRMRSSTDPKGRIDRRRMDILKMVRDDWESRGLEWQYAFGDILQRDFVKEEGKEYPDEFTVLLLKNEHGEVVFAIAESIIIGRAMQVYDQAASAPYDWQFVMRGSRDHARKYGARTFVHNKTNPERDDNSPELGAKRLIKLVDEARMSNRLSPSQQRDIAAGRLALTNVIFSVDGYLTQQEHDDVASQRLALYEHCAAIFRRLAIIGQAEVVNRDHHR